MNGKPRIQNAVVDDGSQLIDSRQPPVGITAKFGSVKSTYEILGTVCRSAVTGYSSIAAIGSRIAVIPGVGVIRIVRVAVACAFAHAGFDFPYQAGDIVLYHCP